MSLFPLSTGFCKDWESLLCQQRFFSFRVLPVGQSWENKAYQHCNCAGLFSILFDDEYIKSLNIILECGELCSLSSNSDKVSQIDELFWGTIFYC